MNRLIRTFCTAGVLAAILASSSCSLFSKQGREAAKAGGPSDDLQIAIKLDKESYRPGEAVLVEVVVTNSSAKPIVLRPLDAHTVTFWFGPEGQDRRFERLPVVSRKEAQLATEPGSAEGGPLAPGESRTRRFLHTRLTAEAGAFAAQAHGDLFDDVAAHQAGRIYSTPVPFRVEGDPLFARDNEGLLMKADAIRIAAREAGEGVSEAGGAARLIEDEMGFYKWWVNLNVAPAGQPAQTASWLIDPYQGRVWAKAQPFTPAPEEKAKPRIRGGAVK